MRALTPVQKQNMRKWLKALESGTYRQAKEVLFNGKGYCCLGVADTVCFNASFTKNDHDFLRYRDDQGRGTDLGVTRARQLGLHRRLTTDEMDRLFFCPYDGCIRMDFVIHMNDALNYSFKKIAKTIQDLGWDRA